MKKKILEGLGGLRLLPPRCIWAHLNRKSGAVVHHGAVYVHALSPCLLTAPRLHRDDRPLTPHRPNGVGGEMGADGDRERRREGRRVVFFFLLPFHFLLQTQPGDRGGGMTAASAGPRSTTGPPATSRVIYDAVKTYAVFLILSPPLLFPFSSASPGVTVLSLTPQTLPRTSETEQLVSGSRCPFIC